MIIKEYLAPNGAITNFHVVSEFKVNFPSQVANLLVLSYPNEEAFLSGANNIWASRPVMPVSAIDSPFQHSVEVWLTENEDSFLFGGSIVADASESLESAKDRAWARIKQLRNVFELSPFAYQDMIFDSDKTRIVGSVQMALIAISAEVEQNFNWTLKDNSVVVLTPQQMVSVGIALGTHINNIYDIGRDLRAQISAATTKEELDLIVWPVG